MTDRKRHDLLAAAAAGDEHAFRRIIAQHQKDMYRVCMSIAGDTTVAEDATQAAWLIAWKKLGNVREPDHLRPWLITVAANEARQILRKHRRRATIETDADVTSQSGGIDPAAGAAALDVSAVISALTVDERTLLALRYVAGFDATEIANATGSSPAAIRQRLKRLLDRLREELADG